MFNGNDNQNNMNNNQQDNNMNGMYNNYNFAGENFEQKRKRKKKNLKIVAIVIGAVVLSGTSGLVGGLATYKIMSKNNTNLVQSTSYAAPEFTSATDGSLTVSQAFEKVKPAVVTISTKGIQQSGYGGFSQEVEGLGSGFIINEDGYILTNNHVVANSSEVKVLLSDGNEVAAKVINTDEQQDLAMIKLADGTKVPGVAELGDSDALYPGEDVIAIGTPLSKNFAQTMTKGIISAVNREVQSSESGNTAKVIQTDAAINSGNSGGPLVNTKGQVIGINSMKMSSSATGSEATIEGMGFSIPINEAKSRLESLSKPILSLGITVTNVTEDMSKQSGYPVGIYVKTVADFSPASKAGLRQDDVITEFDGTKVKTVDELNKLKSQKNAGDKVTMKIVRNKKEMSLDIELQEK
ncbi:trypsin-like peptidase domain-containing protein [Clostridium sp. SHJSY1]|uniref:S1C family serine protease n=1 Tax=Clostridium sp. SHJSY1 TaxID=2942483 RepID=UPI0028747434|nr:trypsin-like peptidase domain-containing protein [Clostridium sp. SHJSY1]MDS0528112.1 trypsin-like peptidase domain-containing protein [Clostridium sp. SHJSY1]